MRPGGPGWAVVSRRLGFGVEPTPGGALAWTNWIAGIIAVYATLFGIGKIVFGYTGTGIAMLAVAAAEFLVDLAIVQGRTTTGAVRCDAPSGATITENSTVCRGGTVTPTLVAPERENVLPVQPMVIVSPRRSGEETRSL